MVHISQLATADLMVLRLLEGFLAEPYVRFGLKNGAGGYLPAAADHSRPYHTLRTLQCRISIQILFSKTCFPHK